MDATDAALSAEKVNGEDMSWNGSSSHESWELIMLIGSIGIVIEHERIFYARMLSEELSVRMSVGLLQLS